MSIEQIDQKTEKTLTETAREIARKYVGLPLAAARDRIAEEANCSKSTAYKAYNYAKRQKKTKQEPAAEIPELAIVEEPDKETTFAEPEKTKAVEPDEVIAPPKIPTAEEKEQLDLFRDMLRGLYTMLFSRDGIAGSYGRSKEQCEMLADQQYRWLIRRYSAQDLERFDTLLLLGAYATVFGGIAKDYLASRRKKEAKSP